MPFIGKVQQKTRSCSDPSNTFLICKKPWYGFILPIGTLWQCPKCERKYKMAIQYTMFDTYKDWERYEK